MDSPPLTAPQPTSRPMRLALVLLVLLALYVRLEYQRALIVDRPLRADARIYTLYAYNLLTSGTIAKTPLGAGPPVPDAYWPPGFPALLAAAMAVGGIDGGYYPVLLTCHAVLGALLVPLTWGIGRRMLPGWAVLGATALLAFCPHLISLGGYLLTETLFTFLQTAALYVFVRALEGRSPAAYALSGLLFGAAYLTRFTLFFMPFLLAAVLFAAHRRRLRAALVPAAVFLLCFGLLAGGWALRNRLSLPPGGDTTARNARVNLVIGAQPGFHAVWRVGDHKRPDSLFLHEARAAEHSLGALAARLYERMRQEPLRYLSWYLLEKPLLMWDWDIVVGAGDIYVFPVYRSLYTVSPAAETTRQIMRGLHPVVLAAALAGLYLLLRDLLRRRRSLLSPPVLVYAVPVYMTLVHMVFQAEPRYSIPLRPQLYLAAFWAAAEATRRIAARRRPTHAPAVPLLP